MHVILRIVGPLYLVRFQEKQQKGKEKSIFE
jgi:hypothetical protein